MKVKVQVVIESECGETVIIQEIAQQRARYSTP